MNNIFYSLTIFSLLLTVSSCKKDDVTPSIDNPFLFCKVDGASFAAEGRLLALAVNNSQYIDIRGRTSLSENEEISLLIPSNATKGSYPIDGDSQAYYWEYINVAQTDSYSANLGMGGDLIVIEEIDALHVKGTFQFVAYDLSGSVKKTISEGKFNVRFL